MCPQYNVMNIAISAFWVSLLVPRARGHGPSRLSFALSPLLLFSTCVLSLFLSIFCVLSFFDCKMRSSIAFGADNVALPSTISSKQGSEIAKSRIFWTHVSAPNLTNATCTRGVAPAGFKTSTFLTFSTHFCFSQKTYF